MRIGLPDGAASAAPDTATASAVTTAATIRVTMLMLLLPPVRSARPELRGAPRRRFVVLDEVVRRRRAPHIERVFRRMVLRAPFEIGRNEVDVMRVLGEAAPGIAHVIEIIR